jgi:hypothetical protein
MIQALKIIGTGLASIGLAGAGMGIGVPIAICCLIYFAFNLGLIELADLSLPPRREAAPTGGASPRRVAPRLVY